MKNGHRNGHRNGHKKKVRYVDFQNNPADHECGLLAAAGMSNNYIQRQEGLTTGQITYRCRLLGISRMKFRNGEGPFARLFLRNARPILEPKFEVYLKQNAPVSHANVSGRRHEPSVSRPTQRYADKIRA